MRIGIYKKHAEVAGPVPRKESLNLFFYFRSIMLGILLLFGNLGRIIQENFRTGPNGHRIGKEPIPDDSGSITKILFIGDFSAFGWGVEFEEAYAYRIAVGLGLTKVLSGHNLGYTCL